MATLHGNLRVRRLLALAVFGAASAPAMAQDASTKDVTKIDLAVDGYHESNVLRESGTIAQQRGRPESDERLTTGVDVQFGRSLGRNSLRIEGFAGYDFYRRNHELNRERLRLAGELGLNAGPCLLKLSPAIARQQSDLSTLSVIDVPTIDSIKNTETVQTYGADIRCGRAFGLRPLAGYERGIGNNSTEQRKISDYRSNRYYGGVSYENPVIGSYTLTYDHRDVTYPRRAGGPLADLSGFKSDSVSLSAERKIGAILTASGAIGYTWVDPTGPVERFRGATWSLAAVLTPASRLQVSLRTTSSTEPSLAAESVYTHNRTYGVQAVYALTSRTSLFAGYDLSKRNYRGSTAVFGPLLDSDKLTRITGGVTLDVSPRLKLTGEVGHERRNANATIYDYSNTFFGLKTRFTL